MTVKWKHQEESFVSRNLGGSEPRGVHVKGFTSGGVHNVTLLSYTVPFCQIRKSLDANSSLCAL